MTCKQLIASWYVSDYRTLDTLEGLEGTKLGVSVAHREELFPDEYVCNDKCPIWYTDSSGDPAKSYQKNPNGSRGGVAAVIGRNGLRLSMMPHSERAYRVANGNIGM